MTRDQRRQRGDVSGGTGRPATRTPGAVDLGARLAIAASRTTNLLVLGLLIAVVALVVL